MQTGLPIERLLQIPQAVAGERSYAGVLEALAGELESLIPFDHLDMVILVGGGREHICFETPVRTVWSQLADAPQPTGASPVRAVLRGAIPHILTEDAFTDERFHFNGALNQPIFEARLRSRVIVPLRVRDTIFGSINISRHSTSSYLPTDLLIGQHCTDLIAPYLFALAEGRAQGRAEVTFETGALRTRLLRLAEKLEEERRRLGMDLHDQTIADLSRIARKVAEVHDSAAGLQPVLAELQSEIGNCLTELRRIVEDARPAVLDLFGFAQAVEQLMAQSRAGVQSAMRMHIEDASEGVADRLPDIQRTLLFRIVQEAINNAVRHSGGTRLSVRLACRAGCLSVEVEDDGSGRVDTGSPGGVTHMRTRAALVGAEFSLLRGRGGCGARVRVRMPLAGGYGAITQ